MARSPASVVDQLAAMGESTHWIVSCYLKLEPRDRARGKYLIKLKNRMKRALGSLDARRPDRAARQAAERDLTRIREYLEHPGNLPPGRGIALFASEPLDLFVAIPMAQVFRSRLAIDHTPLVRELAAVSDEFGRVLCAAYDRSIARFFEVTAREALELPTMTADDVVRGGRFHASSESRTHRGRGEPNGRGVGGSAHGEHNFNQRIREEKHRHYAHIAQRLFTLSRSGDVAGVVLGGNGTDVGAVEPHLHPYIRDAVLGTAKLNPKSASPSEVMDAVLAVRVAREREWEARHVADLAEGSGSGWAVNGIEPTLAALARGQVRTLLVDPTVDRPGYRCGDSGQLSLEPETCGDPEHAHEVADVIDEAIEEALRQGSHVDVVEDGESQRAVDGLAALLRFQAR